MKVVKILETSMGCEFKIGEDHHCQNEARYEVEDSRGKHYVYCKKHTIERVFKFSSTVNDEPFFDGKEFFNQKSSKINLLEKIIYMPILIIVVIVKWIIKLQDRRKRKV